MSWIKHFFDMADTNLTDTITGQVIQGTNGAPTTGGAANSIRFRASNGNLSVGWEPFSNVDFCMMVCARTLDGPDGTRDGGNVSFYMGDPGLGDCYRIQPYYGVHLVDVRTATYSPLVSQRPLDVDVIYALVRRGNRIEHYIYDVDTGSIIYTGLTAITPGSAPTNGFRCGHSSYGDIPGSSPTNDIVQDWYGFLVAHFPNGAPDSSEIMAAMNYHLTNWPTGNKAAYPKWVNEEYGTMTKFTEAPLISDVAGTEALGCSKDALDAQITPSIIRGYIKTGWAGGQPVTNHLLSPAGWKPADAGDPLPNCRIAYVNGVADGMMLVPFTTRAGMNITRFEIDFRGNTGEGCTEVEWAIFDSQGVLIRTGVRSSITADTNLSNVNISDGGASPTPIDQDVPRQFLVGLRGGVGGGPCDVWMKAAVNAFYPEFGSKIDSGNIMPTIPVFAPMTYGSVVDLPANLGSNLPGVPEMTVFPWVRAIGTQL